MPPDHKQPTSNTDPPTPNFKAQPRAATISLHEPATPNTDLPTRKDNSKAPTSIPTAQTPTYQLEPAQTTTDQLQPTNPKPSSTTHDQPTPTHQPQTQKHDPWLRSVVRPTTLLSNALGAKHAQSTAVLTLRAVRHLAPHCAHESHAGNALALLDPSPFQTSQLDSSPTLGRVDRSPWSV